MATFVLNLGLGTQAWDRQVDGTIEVASGTLVATSRISSAISNGLMRLRLARSLNDLSKRLSMFVDGVYRNVEKSAQPGYKAATEPPTPEQIESAIRSLEYLADASRRIFASSAAKGLLNSSMMAAPLRSINKRSEEITDIADWLRASLTYSPKHLEEIYGQGRHALASGEMYELSQVK